MAQGSPDSNRFASSKSSVSRSDTRRTVVQDHILDCDSRFASVVSDAVVTNEGD